MQITLLYMGGNAITKQPDIIKRACSNAVKSGRGNTVPSPEKAPGRCRDYRKLNRRRNPTGMIRREPTRTKRVEYVPADAAGMEAQGG